MSTSATSTQKIADDILVDLALQGGGAHGAFTWGVLDRLLEEPRLGIDGISGTSAGAMNAAVLADGYTDGGAEGARRRSKPSGPASRTRPVSVRFSVAPSTGCSVAGRSTNRRCSSRWI
jgi:predicted acylesterase/phospholipase RssA